MYLLTRKHNHSFLWFARFALICTLVLSMAGGCKDHPKDKLREGRSALAAKNPDLAEARLNEALQADPTMIEARRLMIDVHLMRSDFPKAEQTLVALWNDLGFERPITQIPPEERPNRQLMADQFNDLYRRWAESTQPAQNPEQFEEIVKKGLAHNPRSTRLNSMLVDFYKERAEKLLEHGEKLQAAKTLEQIPELLTLPNTRQAAITRAETLRHEAFNDAILARFENELKPQLIASNQFDTERNAVIIRLSEPVNRRLIPKNPADHAPARKQALETLAPKIAQTTIKIADLPADTPIEEFSELPYSIVSENFVRGNFTLVVALPLTSIWELSFRLHEKNRLALEKNKKAGDNPDSTKPSPETDDEPTTDSDNDLNE